MYSMGRRYFQNYGKKATFLNGVMITFAANFGYAIEQVLCGCLIGFCDLGLF